MTRTTQAMMVPGAGERFSRRVLSIDDPRPGEVLVRIEAVGLCHSDLSVRAGEFPFPLPGVPGHEAVGVVEGVGHDLGARRVGDRVVLTFDSCGRCANCAQGSPALCRDFLELNFTNGARPDGSATLWDDGAVVHGSFFGQSSFAGYALVGERNAVPLPAAAADVAPELLAPLGCGVQTGAGAVLNVLRPGAGSTLTVFGAGTVGLSAVMAAALLPLRRLIVIDVKDSRLALARDLGATHVVNPRDGDPVEMVRELTGGGTDFAVESSGVRGVLEQAVQSLATGGVAGVVGVPAFGVTAPLDVADLVNGNKHVVGIVEGRSNPPLFLPLLSELVASGRLPLGKLVDTFPLEEIERAAGAMASGETVKPVLLPGG